MVTIKITQYQKGDIKRYLEYAKHKKFEDLNKKEISKGEYDYTIKIIDELIEILNGKKVAEDYFNVPSKSYREKHGKKKMEGEGKFWRKI